MIAGTTKHLTGITQVILAGAAYTPTDITNKLTQIRAQGAAPPGPTTGLPTPAPAGTPTPAPA